MRVAENMERETGIEPATNSLEGCDSTIELLPRSLFFNDFHSVLLVLANRNAGKTGYNGANLHRICANFRELLICTNLGRLR